MKKNCIDVGSSLMSIAIFLIATTLSSCTKDLHLDDVSNANESLSSQTTNYSNGWSINSIGSSISTRINSMITADEKEFWGAMHSIVLSFVDLAENNSNFVIDLLASAGASEAVSLEIFFQNYSTYSSTVSTNLYNDIGLTLAEFLENEYTFNGSVQIPYVSVPNDGGLSEEGEILGVLGFEGDADDTYGDMYPGVMGEDEVLVTFDPEQMAKTQDLLTVLIVIGLIAVPIILNNQFGTGGVAVAAPSSYESGSGTFGLSWPSCAEYGADLENTKMRIKMRKEIISNHTELEMSFTSFERFGSTTSFIEDLPRALRVKTIHKNDVNTTTFTNLYSFGEFGTAYTTNNDLAVYGVYYDYDWIAGKWTFETSFNDHVGRVTFRSNEHDYMRWKVDKFEWCFGEYSNYSNSGIEFQKKAGS
ncbi:hypothetical protein [Phaeocystidibacter luteus]|uniref:Uncharacterized protein n=1 Tax=Phaeocystidibacter luteus TaxID=911197 RepID=A0A6N6RCR2_9FLAO|nr:hypothetical protein [Phaeocystidibacter luteus]KAB2805427.1 hypothetical protein F8C67_13310 [Phaeocystidibacter luteus]